MRSYQTMLLSLVVVLFSCIEPPSATPDTDTYSDTDDEPDTDTPPTPMGQCAGPRQSHLAYAWSPVVDPTATPNVINAGQVGIRDLFDTTGTPKEDAWRTLENHWNTAGEGRRALVLRAWNSDTSPHNHPDDPPYYWDNGVAELTRQCEQLAAEMIVRGLQPDWVFLDYEWDLSRGYLQRLSDAQRSALVNDARYATDIEPLFDILTNRWTEAALPFTGTPDSVLADPWTLHSYQWNRTMKRRQNVYYHRAITDTLQRSFPDVQVSNYDDWIPNNKDLVPDLNGHAQTIIGFSDGDVLAGTRSSVQIYARMGQIINGWKNNPDSLQYPTSYPATPANALRLAVRKAASAVHPDVGVDLWVAPKKWSGHPVETPLACPELADDENSECSEHWEESILHSVLLTNGPIIWWVPGASTPATDQRLQGLLSTLDEVAGCADRQSLGAVDTGWDAAVLVSGMRVESWNWWRITSTTYPAPTEGLTETGSQIEVRWSDQTLVIPEGQRWTDTDAQGVWVAQPATAAPPYWTD